jgi:LacI family transcriptional regulator
MSSHKDITIYDIARALEISPATVSRGLKDHPGLRKDTKKRILEAAKTMGYQHNTFASNLRNKKTHTIGVVIPRLNSYFMSAVIAGMEKVANERGYMLLISQTQESFKKEVEAIHTMFNSRVDGMLVSLSYDTETLDHLENVLKKDIPVIFFDRTEEHPKCTNIEIDNMRAGYDATMHLLENECKRIVFISGNLHRNVYADRLKGYKLALMEKGVEFNSDLIIVNNLSEQAAIEASQKILKMDPLPDGIFASNDTSAVTCIKELTQAGISIPDQIAVVGFNNDPISRVISPNLTTVHYPGQEMGEVAATTLINALNKIPTASLNTLVLRHKLIVRESSIRKKEIV